MAVIDPVYNTPQTNVNTTNDSIALVKSYLILFIIYYLQLYIKKLYIYSLS